MDMNLTPSGERIYIGFFGCTNAGKSTLMNAITNQNLSVVSDKRGTTTDPVRKSMELLPLGPVVMVDTPGYDDDSTLGSLRIEKSMEILRQVHIAILVADISTGLSDEDKSFISKAQTRHTPLLVIWHKCDLSAAPAYPSDCQLLDDLQIPYLSASSLTGTGIEEIKNHFQQFASMITPARVLVADLVQPYDTVILVTPIDASAPKGRLILPQQQTIRELLDTHVMVMIVQPEELASALASLKKAPALVITDSQAFGRVSDIVPKDIPLTSFSILFARYKGNLTQLLEGAKILDTLSAGDSILISEGCTHHRQCGDIGTEKLPAMIRSYTGVPLTIDFTSGTEFPQDISSYNLIIHCGGCMLNEKEMQYRLGHATTHSVPMTNYGICMAHMRGILDRSIAPLK